MPVGKYTGYLVGAILDEEDDPDYLEWVIETREMAIRNGEHTSLPLFAKEVHDYLKEF
jgi:hypothetical protein